MKILIIGAGMYVTGRSGGGMGTILASICETSKTVDIERVTIVARKATNAQIVADAADRLNKALHSSLNVNYQTISGTPDEVVEQLCASEDYTAAIVCVPDHLHFAYGKALLNNDLHVLMVKPFVETLDEGIELTQLAKLKGLFGMVEFHKRWDPSNLIVKKKIQSGELGALTYGVVEYSQKSLIPLEVFRGWSERTNIFQYLGVHYVDLFWYLTGFTPKKVSSVGTYGVLAEKGIKTFDSVHTTIQWSKPSGGIFVSQHATNWIDPDTTSAMSDQGYRMVGGKGRMNIDQKQRGIQFVSPSSATQELNPYFSEILPDMSGPRFQGYGHDSIRTFLTDVFFIKAGRITADSLERTRPSFADSLISTAVVESSNESLALHGEWVDVRNIKV